MTEAPTDGTEILVLCRDRRGSRYWIVTHWAEGSGDGFQPPFRGWFYLYGDSGFAEISMELLGWLTLPAKPAV